jgi:hypothetical protein
MSDEARRSELTREVEALVAEFRHYENYDQKLVFGVVWISIIASAVSALLAALGQAPKELVAVLAALPALCLTIESNLKFAQQYQNRKMSTIALLELQDSLKYQDLPTADGAKAKAAILKAFAEKSVIPQLAREEKRPASPQSVNNTAERPAAPSQKQPGST